VNRRNGAKRRKLTPEQVEIVRSSEKSGVQLAREFGISHNAISQIRLGRTYRGNVVSLASVFTWRPAA
jgi:transposase-like protein